MDKWKKSFKANLFQGKTPRSKAKTFNISYNNVHLRIFVWLSKRRFHNKSKIGCVFSGKLSGLIDKR